MLTLEELVRACNDRAIKWTAHTLMRLQERNITRSDVISCITKGIIIEQYPDDYPYPSCLILGTAISGKYLHTVVGVGGGFMWVITAYYPTLDKWQNDFKTRKEN